MVKDQWKSILVSRLQGADKKPARMISGWFFYTCDSRLHFLFRTQRNNAMLFFKFHECGKKKSVGILNATPSLAPMRVKMRSQSHPPHAWPKAINQRRRPMKWTNCSSQSSKTRSSQVSFLGSQALSDSQAHMGRAMRLVFTDCASRLRKKMTQGFIPKKQQTLR